MVTRDNPATYFLNQGEADGFEYDLAQRFADYLGVELKLYTASVSQALKDVEEGRAHIAAAGLSITGSRKLSVDFGPDYQEVTQQLLARRNQQHPETLSDLENYDIAILDDSSHLERLIQIRANFPDLYWESQNIQSTLGLMRLVDAGEFDLTIVDSAEFAVTQRYFPKLQAVFDISTPEKIAWALPKGSNDLLLKTTEFFNEQENSGELDQLKEYHFGYIKSFNYVEVTTLMHNLETQLIKFRDLFIKAGEDHEVDWKLLAAISYQESHWKPEAVSPTGVRGLMMLTQRTAAEMDVSDRVDPAQSIDGGARYLVKVEKQFPERIQNPDRLWFALASYNVGIGHLEDARILTQKDGKNPDLWSDVREYLPLLSDKKYYSRLKHGKARGSEPVKYVENIRDYYDLLRWLIQEEDPITEDEGETEPGEILDAELNNDQKASLKIRIPLIPLRGVQVY